MGIVKVINGKKFTIWSRHKTKSKAHSAAKALRGDGYQARVIKNTNVYRTKKERSHPWEVYVYRKPGTRPFKLGGKRRQ